MKQNKITKTELPLKDGGPNYQDEVKHISGLETGTVIAIYFGEVEKGKEDWYLDVRVGDRIRYGSLRKNWEVTKKYEE